MVQMTIEADHYYTSIRPFGHIKFQFQVTQAVFSLAPTHMAQGLTHIVPQFWHTWPDQESM